MGLVSLKQASFRSHQEPSWFRPFVIPKRVREATYNVVFAALKTAPIRQMLRKPGAIGILELVVAIIIIDVPSVASPVLLLNMDGKEGSCHETFR